MRIEKVMQRVTLEIFMHLASCSAMEKVHKENFCDASVVTNHKNLMVHSTTQYLKNEAVFLYIA